MESTRAGNLGKEGKDIGFTVNVLCNLCQSLADKLNVMRNHQGNMRWIQLRNRPGFKRLGVRLHYGATKHHPSFGSLQDSAQSGCHLCARLGSMEEGHQDLLDLPRDTKYAIKLIRRTTNDLQIKLRVLDGSNSIVYFALQRGRVGGVSSTTLKHPRTDAAPVLALAKRWISRCRETHEECRQREVNYGQVSQPQRDASRKSRYVPTRLVYVTGNKECPKARLVVSAELQADVEYLTLSHCWGGTTTIRLTEATMDGYLSMIDMQSLPRNFQDAVRITLSLGFQYIWIDSLCILQDSATDWNRESAMMGDIYLYSACTVAAVSAKDSHGGCFQRRSALDFLPCQVVAQTQWGKGLYLGQNDYRHEHLHTRAWVLQERCLSVRTLNFGKHQLYWDCVTTCASEAAPDLPPAGMQPSVKRCLTDIISHAELFSDYLIWSRVWWRLVEEYTKCDFTYISDKWKAIEGLAKIIGSNLRIESRYGLWATDMVDELLWGIVKQKATRLPIDAPSWSWLSIDGPVKKEYYRSPGDDCSGFHAFHINDVERASTPRRLKVVAHSCPITWEERNSGSYEDKLVVGYYFKPESQGAYTEQARWWPDTPPDPNWETWGIQVVKTTAWWNRGLVVVPVDSARKEWRRVGFFRGTSSWGEQNYGDARTMEFTLV